MKIKSKLGALVLASTCALLLYINTIEVRANESDSSKPGDSKLPKIFDYEEYLRRFRKAYSPIETFVRAKLFFGRTLKIFQHNILFKKHKYNYYLAQNEFTDITPEELNDKFLRNEFNDMQPVAEALKNPDAPADSVLADEVFDDESEKYVVEASRSEQGKISDSTEQVQKEPIMSRPVLNFFHDEAFGNPRELFKELKAKPGLANKIAETVELKNLKDATTEMSREKVERARSKNGIVQRPVVKSNNENYDHESIPSYGLLDFFFDQEITPENYAKFALEGDFTFETENPKPPPVAPKKSHPESSGSIHKFFRSVQAIYDLIAFDYYDDYEDGEEEEDMEPERPKIIYDIDWRESGCISRPREQKSCNSCYAFATLGMIEYFYCRQTKQLTEFSAQYVIDCGLRLNMGGCRGGKISSVGNFITNYGVELSTHYPYVGREDQCPYKNDEEFKKKAGYLRPTITHWHNFPEMVAWSKWVKKSPIIVGINLPSDFMAYGGGIHDGSDCNPDMVHALLLVGSGHEDGKRFWLLRNSYSDVWGESGYIRLSKSAPLKCFNVATVVRAKFSSKEPNGKKVFD